MKQQELKAFYAGMALQGMLANPKITDWPAINEMSTPIGEEWEIKVTAAAAHLAGALIEAQASEFCDLASGNDG